MRSVVQVLFMTPDDACCAIDQLPTLGGRGVRTRSAALVLRTWEGEWAVPIHINSSPFGGTLAGGLLGALVGAWFGLAVLASAGMAGLLVGSVTDLFVGAERQAIVVALADRVPPGWAALVADIEEHSAEPFDAAMTSLAGTVTRMDRWGFRAAMLTGMDPPRPAI